MESYIRTDSPGYFGTGRSSCNRGCNSDCKVPQAKLRFRLAIPPRPYGFGSSNGHRTPIGDPSLPTTEEGITERVGKTDNRIRQGRGFV